PLRRSGRKSRQPDRDHGGDGAGGGAVRLRGRASWDLRLGELPRGIRRHVQESTQALLLRGLRPPRERRGLPRPPQAGRAGGLTPHSAALSSLATVSRTCGWGGGGQEGPPPPWATPPARAADTRRPRRPPPRRPAAACPL